MQQHQKSVDTLRKFFTVTVAAFEMHHSISLVFGNKGDISDMHHLHLIAKEEIEKVDPDLAKIDNLLSMMEDLTKKYNLKP